MGLDPKWGRFPICLEMSRFVPVCPDLSEWAPKTTNGDKTGHFGTNGETPPFRIHPHLPLLDYRLTSKEFTPPLWKLLFFLSFSGSEACMLYILLSAPMVHTLCLCFFQQNATQQSSCCWEHSSVGKSVRTLVCTVVGHGLCFSLYLRGLFCTSVSPINGN